MSCQIFKESIPHDILFSLLNKICTKTEKFYLLNKISYKKIVHDDKLSKVSIIGAGMITTPGISYRMFQALAKKKINILVISK